MVSLTSAIATVMTTPAAVTTTQVDQLPGYRPTATSKVTASLQQGEFQGCHLGRVCGSLPREFIVCNGVSLQIFMYSSCFVEDIARIQLMSEWNMYIVLVLLQISFWEPKYFCVLL